MQFHTVKQGSRPLLAFPGSASMPSGMRCSAIECYPSHTWKKRWLRRGLMMASRLGLLTVLFPARGIPVLGVSDAAFSQWLEDICRAMGWDSVYPVFFWPGDPNRGRIYCYLLDPNGVRVGFCKFGLDSTNNRLIQREARTMEVLKEMDLKRCRVPEVHALAIWVNMPMSSLKLHLEVPVPSTGKRTRVSNHWWPSMPGLHIGLIGRNWSRLIGGWS